MKKCNRCGLEKELSSFRLNRARKDGVSTYCSPCEREYQKTRYHNPEKHKQIKMDRIIYLQNRRDSSRKWYLRTTYNISSEQYLEMLQKNNDSCWICNEKKDYWLHVDHDHSCCPGSKSCGKCVRGLLCHNCNSMLGHSKDSSDILRKAASYLE
jgi:Recombination endonuclease VII